MSYTHTHRLKIVFLWLTHIWNPCFFFYFTSGSWSSDQTHTHKHSQTHVPYTLSLFLEMQQQKISGNTVTVHCNKFIFFYFCTLQIVPLFPVTYLSTSGRFCTIATQLKSQISTFFLCFHFFLYSPLGYRQMCWLAPPSGFLLSRFEQRREVYVSERVCWVSYQTHCGFLVLVHVSSCVKWIKHPNQLPLSSPRFLPRLTCSLSGGWCLGKRWGVVGGLSK